LSSNSRSVIRCSLSTAFFSRSTRLLSCFAKDFHNTTSLTAALQQKHHQEKYIASKLTISVWLMVIMLVRKAFIFSLSLKISPCQGVSFQSISHRGNLRLEGKDSGTCAPDVSGPLGALSI
jgi:hypothetical protein